MKFLFLGLSCFFSIALLATAQAKDSLFVMPEAQIRAHNPFPCDGGEIAQKLKNLKPMCGQSLEEWRAYAMTFVDVAGDRGNGPKKLEDLREVVNRNTRISESYAQLYLHSQESLPACGRSLLPWLAGGSLGSLKSGGVMRSGLSNEAGGIREFDEVADANYRPRYQKLFGPLAAKAMEQSSLTLGFGNREIFKDLFWQLLAGSTCGAAEVVRTIEAEPKWAQDNKLALAHRSWSQMKEAEASCEEGKVLAANNDLVEVEQRLVAQPAMYDGLVSQFGGWVLGKIADAAVPVALTTFDTFPEHARKTTPSFLVNFANPNQRIAWMKDQLAAMEAAFLSKPDFTRVLFCAVTNESQSTREFLKTWQASSAQASGK